MKELLKEYKKYNIFEKYSDILNQSFEFIIAILAGGFIEAWIGRDPTKDFDNWTPLVGFTLAAIILIVRRLLKQHYFPETIATNFEIQMELDKIKKEVERKNTIDGYVDLAIQKLNSNTCDLDSGAIDHLCDNPMDSGLSGVLNSIIDQTQYFLDTPTTRFTIALFTTSYLDTSNDLVYNQIQKTITFRDDFSLKDQLIDDILNHRFSGDMLKIQNCARQSYFDRKLSHINLDQNIKLITCPIPDVCDSSSCGVLMIFCDKATILPNDLENILLIFSRILTNWISKYSDCVFTRVNAKNEAMNR